MAEREAVVGRVVESAERHSVALTPAEAAVSPAQFRREDGTSVFRPRHATKYTSASVLAAEERLLNRAKDLSAPVLSTASVVAVARCRHDGRRPTRSQAEAISAIATSGRQVDLLVGPAGAGKTTTMHALLVAWAREHGRHSVVGLTPSAAATEVLAGDLGISCENTAKWLHDYASGRQDFKHDQLVIIDEATLADTSTLDRITGIAATAGAKVLLVGDWAQLQSVDAGGAFTLLADARSDAPELVEVHRFRNEWEGEASLDLREGRLEAVAAYARHDRLRDGTTEEMLDAAYMAWMEDQANGRASILVTETAETVHALNSRARAERVLTGQTQASREVTLASGEPASAGDIVITRKNDRRLRSPRGVWVRNGDRWRIDDVGKNGTLVVSRRNSRAATLILPVEYVAEHVDLGYAITAHRAQGVTVDTAHVLVSAKTTKENLYVSMTRGRDANIAYVALDHPDDTHAGQPDDREVNARTVLYGVLQHSGAKLSAHRTIIAEHETWSSIAQLAAEYDAIAAIAQRDRWEDLIRLSGLTKSQADSVIASDAFGPLTAALRRAEASGHTIERLLPHIVAQRDLADADDIAAVIQHRLRMATKAKAPHRGAASSNQRFIAGMIPEAIGALPAAMREALDERKSLIEARADALAEAAAVERPVWVRRLGEPPGTPEARLDWIASVATIAAYRDRYRSVSDLPLGSDARDEAQRADRDRAFAAERRARALALSRAAGRSERSVSVQSVLI